MRFFLGSETISNHGTSTGIWPRFLLQMISLGKMAFGDDFKDKRITVYYKTVMPELENLYDIYHKIFNLLDDYKEGIQNGKYYKINKQGQFSHERQNEVEIINLTKDFFIRGKITLVNFVKSEVIDDDKFCFSNFFFCGDDKFEKIKFEYLNSSDGRYKPLIDLIEKANKTFLKDFNIIRGEIEHKLFSIEKFKIEKSQDDTFVLEPMLGDKILSVKLEYFYENIMDFIEKIFVYFLGINAEIKYNGFLTLDINRDYNYPSLEYKYLFSFGGVKSAISVDKCLYD